MSRAPPRAHATRDTPPRAMPPDYVLIEIDDALDHAGGAIPTSAMLRWPDPVLALPAPAPAPATADVSEEAAPPPSPAAPAVDLADLAAATPWPVPTSLDLDPAVAIAGGPAAATSEPVVLDLTEASSESLFQSANSDLGILPSSSPEPRYVGVVFEKTRFTSLDPSISAHPWSVNRRHGNALNGVFFATEEEAARAHAEIRGWTEPRLRADSLWHRYHEMVPAAERNVSDDRVVRFKRKTPESQYVGVQILRNRVRSLDENLARLPWRANFRDGSAAYFATEEEAARAYAKHRGWTEPVLRKDYDHSAAIRAGIAARRKYAAAAAPDADEELARRLQHGGPLTRSARGMKIEPVVELSEDSDSDSDSERESGNEDVEEKPAGRPCTSKYVGVSAGRHNWRVRHKSKQIGSYATEIEAARAFADRVGSSELVLRDPDKWCKTLSPPSRPVAKHDSNPTPPPPGPGAELVGAKVSRLVVPVDGNGKTCGEAYREEGVVIGYSSDSTEYGNVYNVKYVDGDEEEEEEEDLIFEELLLVLKEDRAPAASVEVATIFTNAIIKTKGCPKKAILDRLRNYTSTIKAGGNVWFGGFETVTDAMNREAFQPVVFDASWGEHKFGYHFPTRWGAAAAHDIFVRVLQSYGVGTIKGTRTNYKPDLPWHELVGIMLAGANDRFRDDEDAAAATEKKKPAAAAAADPVVKPATPASKRRKAPSAMMPTARPVKPKPATSGDDDESEDSTSFARAKKRVKTEAAASGGGAGGAAAVGGGASGGGGRSIENAFKELNEWLAAGIIDVDDYAEMKKEVKKAWMTQIG